MTQVETFSIGLKSWLRRDGSTWIASCGAINVLGSSRDHARGHGSNSRRGKTVVRQFESAIGVPLDGSRHPSPRMLQETRWVGNPSTRLPVQSLLRIRHQKGKNS